MLEKQSGTAGKTSNRECSPGCSQALSVTNQRAEQKCMKFRKQTVTHRGVLILHTSLI